MDGGQLSALYVIVLNALMPHECDYFLILCSITKISLKLSEYFETTRKSAK